MKCPHCNKEGLSLLDVNTFSKKEKIITCRVCNKQSYFPNLTINEENPFLYTIIIILLVVSFFSPYPVNIVLLTILLIIAVSMLFTKKVYPFNTEEELNLLKKSFLPLEKTEDTRLKDYPEALKYYKNNNAFELAIFYEETLKDYEEAILWYEKAYTQGNQDSLNIIGLIYKNKLNDYDKAKEYFIKSIKIGNIDSIQNIALFYYSVLKDQVTASAYYIALIDAKYSKNEVLKLLREDLNIDENSIKEGYELQLTIPELPRKYKGKLDLNENTKKDYNIDPKYDYYIKEKPSKSDFNKKNKIISILLILVIAIFSFVVYKYAYSYDKELDNYPEAKMLYENRDNANATFELALFYLNLNKKEKAIYWFKKSVGQENSMAAIRLAYIEENKKDYWFNKAFKLGYNPFTLSKIDINNSAKWLKIAYDMGNCEAVKIKIEEYKKTYINTVKDSFSPISLAYAEKEFGEHMASYRGFYHSGCKELANDIGKLYLINQTSYLRSSPKRGIDTMTYLDNIYRNINSSRKENIKEALKWYKIASENGDLASSYEIGNIYEEIYKDKDKAIFWYKKSADKGFIDAINKIKKLTSKKPTALKEVIEMNIKLKNSWENANKDPEEAIKVGYAYAKYKNDYNNAILWYKYSDNIKSLPKTSNLICYSYQQLKEYNEALKWCKKAIDLGSTKALFQIATTYFNLNEYNNALKYFLESSKMGNTSELNLGLVYSKLKNFKESEKWYKKAIEKKNMEAFKHISYFYHENLKDDIKASAYFLSTINTIYVKYSVLDFLQKDWKIPNETIKKGYELQLNSDEFPIKYKGKLDLE